MVYVVRSIEVMRFFNSFSAHLDIEHMEELRSSLGDIPDTLAALHETAGSDDGNTGKTMAYSTVDILLLYPKKLSYKDTKIYYNIIQ